MEFNTTNRRIDFYDCLKGLAIFFVVLQHLMTAMEDYSTLRTVSKFLHMPVFFFVSGFFSYLDTTSLKFYEFTIKKVKRLMIPYLIWSLIATINKTRPLNLLNIATAYFNNILYGESVWYFGTLFIVLVIFFLIYKISRGNDFLCGVLILIICFVFPAVKVDYLTFYKLQEHFLFFYFGFLLKKHNIRIEEIRCNKSIRALLLGLAFIGVIVLNKFSGFESEVWSLQTFVQTSLDSIGLFIIVLFAHLLQYVPKISRIIKDWGRYSLYIYCIHMFFLRIFERFTTPNYIAYLIIAILTIYTCILVAKYVLTKFSILRKLLGGEKS